MRRAHYLRRNKGVEYPHNCVWFDTETDGLIESPTDTRQVLRFGYAAHRRRTRGEKWTAPKWKRFSTPDTFWSWVIDHTRPRVRLDLFCHNAAFDIPVVHGFDWLRRDGWTMTRAVIDSPPVILAWRKGSVTLRVIDTLNIWRLPLTKIGEHVGLAKLPMPALDAPSKEWTRYARRDVEIIMVACLEWFAFLNTHQLGGFAPTLAAQAMRAYRHRFMTEPIFIDDNERALDMARASYLGGRVECFRLGQLGGPLYQLDINSQYPAHMLAEQFPTKLIGVYKRPTKQEILRWLTQNSVVARCTLNTDEAAYALLDNGKLIFPLGQFTTTLTTPELSYAVRKGHLSSLSVAAVYECRPIFRSFVQTLYAIRLAAFEKGDDTLAWQIRMLMNSLSGKWGQRGRVYDEIGRATDDSIKVWTEIDASSGQVRRMRQFAGVVQALSFEGEASESHPAIVAHITAHARLGLWRLIGLAGRGNVFYCDTDSILVNERGHHALAAEIDTRQLGKLKCEGVYQSAELRGPKDYNLGATRKIKGVKGQAAWIDNDMVLQDHFTTLVGLLRRGDLTAPIVVRQSKILHRVYTKGVVQADGRVLPLRLAPE